MSAARARAIIAIRGGTIKASVLQVDGTLYFTTPDNAWAVDARDGRELWHYFWKTKGGTHIGNRGLGMWNNYLYHGDARRLPGLARRQDRQGALAQGDRRSRRRAISRRRRPIVVGNHVLVGTGNDIDAPGFLQSFDPETGELQWKFYTVPMKKGDPGLDTWASLDAARHGGAQTWIPGAYDPETKLYIFGTGNPTPAYTTGTRGEGDNLFTCSLVARERGHRQDGLVFPDLAARHARLGFRADAGAGRRRCSTARCASWC